MEYALGAFITLITFLIAYYLGQGKITKETITGAVQQLVVSTKKKLDISPVGVIKSPTARDIYLKEHPLEKAEQEEMKKELDKLNL